ncbi:MULTISPECIES: hypothetical protein [unclassified Sulfitobacter]|jgi:hypothetical protein|nr:hypothetical protein [Sulfitobacter sp. BSw21498]|tara:strand:+ start:6036 stop:6158 length:123 start_codon:yes stop_codon:yes gene_type:complete
MMTLKTNYRGLSLLMDLNWDRALYFGFLLIALTAGAWIGA